MPASNILDQLMAFWELEEASGTRADAHTGGIDLTVNGSVGSTTGKVGNAASFAASAGNWLTAGDPADLRLGHFDWTWSGWVMRRTAGTFMGIVGRGDINSAATDAGEYGIRFHSTAGALQIRVRDTAGTRTNSGVTETGTTVDTWHFMVVSYTASTRTVRVRVDMRGTWNDITMAADLIATAPTVSTRLGVTGTVHELDGAIDQLGLWKRILTEDEQTWLYNSGAGRSYAELEAAGGGAEPPQFARPAADESASGWTASTETDLFAVINEETPDDDDYISSSVGGDTDTYVLRLSELDAVTSGDGDTLIRYRAGKIDGAGDYVTDGDTVNLLVELFPPSGDMDGGTLLASRNDDLGALTAYTLTVPTAVELSGQHRVRVTKSIV